MWRMIPQIHIEDYNYALSDERIAKYPLAERDASKLLVYRDGIVTDAVFRQLPDYLPADALMVFNDTKVVPARLHFQRESGAHIEIFCLEPVDPVEYNLAFAADACCTWKCVIGNAKRWKGDVLHLYNPQDDPALARMNLRAEPGVREDRTGTVTFRWDDGAPFSQVLERCGQVPIPPYLGRETERIDEERYQTLYARIRGSVAAPTAGLHFTGRVLDDIAAKGITCEHVCLHVGAGTFLPVKDSLVSKHAMHREPFAIRLDLLRKLESLYYAGVSCIEGGAPEDVAQWVPYEREYPYSTEEALDALIAWLERSGKETLTLGTRIIIVPGFRFRLVDILVTNFHQPESTLILLVSAFVDGDWRTIYDHALAEGYRFLSYGDSSVLFRRSLVI